MLSGTTTWDVVGIVHTSEPVDALEQVSEVLNGSGATETKQKSPAVNVALVLLLLFPPWATWRKRNSVRDVNHRESRRKPPRQDGTYKIAEISVSNPEEKGGKVSRLGARPFFCSRAAPRAFVEKATARANVYRSVETPYRAAPCTDGVCSHVPRAAPSTGLRDRRRHCDVVRHRTNDAV